MPDLLTGSFYTRSRMSLADLIDAVRADLGLTDDSFISDDDVTRWAVECQNRLASELRWLLSVESWSVSGSVPDVQLPPDFLFIVKVTWNAEPLVYRSMEQLYDADPQWRTNTGTPEAYSLGLNSRLLLYPVPESDDPDDLQLIYAATPPSPGGSDDLLYCPAGSEDAITNFCLWKASQKDLGREGARRASDYRVAWLQDLQRLKGQMRTMAEEAPLVVGSRRLRPYLRPSNRLDSWVNR